MTDKVQAGCLCGAVRFECDPQQFMAAAVCHCRDCQYVSGGGPANIVVAPEPAFEMLQGETKEHSVTGDSGKAVTRHFCPDCGTHVFSELDAALGLKMVKVGTFDDASFFTPQMAVWTSSAPAWAHIDPSVPQFEKAAG